MCDISPTYIRRRRIKQKNERETLNARLGPLTILSGCVRRDSGVHARPAPARDPNGPC